jgi:hypothetical protein
MNTIENTEIGFSFSENISSVLTRALDNTFCWI